MTVVVVDVDVDVVVLGIVVLVSLEIEKEEDGDGEEGTALVVVCFGTVYLSTTIFGFPDLRLLPLR